MVERVDVLSILAAYHWAGDIRKVEFKIRRIRGQGNFWVGEISIRYDGGAWNYGCSILEFRGDKVARETIYFAEGWEAPEWRAPWRAAWQDESLEPV